MRYCIWHGIISYEACQTNTTHKPFAHFTPLTHSDTADPSVYQCGFELITAKTRKRAQSSIVLTAEDEATETTGSCIVCNFLLLCISAVMCVVCGM